MAIAVLGVLVGIQVAASGGLFLFHRHFWSDEILTLTIVSDPDFVHSMRALAGGVETHPPTYYWLVRAFTFLVGSDTETAYRGFSFVCAFLFLAGVFAILRRVYTTPVALAATLAVWCSPLVLFYAFEARSYAAWLAATAWYAFFLAVSRGRESRWITALLAFCSVLVCTLHYFGIISLAVVTGAEWWFERRPIPRRVLLGVAAGPVALALCLPLLLNQRSALGVLTWLKTPDLKTVAAFFSLFFDVWLVMIVAGLFRFIPASAKPGQHSPARGDVAGLLALASMPLLVVAFSYVCQPATVPRYAVLTVAAIGPAVGAVLARFSRWWAIAGCICIVFTGTYRLHVEARICRQADEQQEKLIDAIRRSSNAQPVTFELVTTLYVVHRYAPDFAARCFYMDFDRDQQGYANTTPAFGQALERRYQIFYGNPSGMTLDELRRLPRRFLVLDFTPRPDIDLGEGPYPGFALRHVESGLYELVPSPAR